MKKVRVVFGRRSRSNIWIELGILFTVLFVVIFAARYGPEIPRGKAPTHQPYIAPEPKFAPMNRQPEPPASKKVTPAVPTAPVPARDEDRKGGGIPKWLWD